MTTLLKDEDQPPFTENTENSGANQNKTLGGLVLFFDRGLGRCDGFVFDGGRAFVLTFIVIVILEAFLERPQAFAKVAHKRRNFAATAEQQ
jgi:hypothetical protein